MELSQPRLMKREHARQVIGVIGHDTGHVTAGQPARGLVAFLAVLEDREPLPANRY